MKDIANFKRTLFVLLIMMMIPFAAAAQDDIDFEDDVDDEEQPRTPINNLLMAGLIVGTAIGYRFLKKDQTV